MKIHRLGVIALLLPCTAVYAQSTGSPAPSVAVAPTASLTPLQDAFAALQKTITARIEEANAGETVPNRFDWTTVEAELEQLKAATLSTNQNEAKNSVRNLIRRIKSEELKQLLENVSTAVDAQKTAEAELKRQKILGQLTEIATAAFKATKASDIDPLFDRLTALEEELGNNYDSRLGRVRNQINQSQNFLRQWQDLVDNVASGETQQARQALNNFRHNSTVPAGISRSELRDQIRIMRGKLGISEGGESPIAKLSIDNIAEVQKQLIDASEGWNNDQNERNTLISQLDVFLMASRALEAGNTDEALQALRMRNGYFYGGMRSSSTYATFQRLRNEWVIRSLPALTGLKDLQPAKPGETANAYVQRLLIAADASLEWDRAQALAHVAESLDTPAVNMPTQPSQIKGSAELAIVLYQRALIMEKAGQRDAATELYRDALKQAPLPKLQEKLIARLLELAAVNSGKTAE
ncbi:MAG: hypothetical protein ABW223_06910 [Rariglobus sp.]